MALQNDLERIKPFIDEDETSIDAYSSAEETGILTDRRLIRFRTSGRGESTSRVTSTYFNRVCKTSVEHKTTPDFDQDSLIYGILALVVGFVAIVLAGEFDGSTAGVLMVVGAGVGILGVVLLIEAYNTPDGSVTISLKTTDGDVAVNTRLPEDHLEFAHTLSKTVSNAHTPSNRATQKVG